MHLLAYPAAPRGPVREFEVAAGRPDGRTLRLSYRLDADLSQLRLPAGVTPARADDLWRHTCFEAFIAEPGVPGYFEFNFSPSGQWAAYAFTGYRAGMRQLDLPAPPAAAWRRADGRLDLDVGICLDGLLSGAGDASPRLSLAAVIEEQSGTMTYWALRHAANKPDFHDPDGFVLEVQGQRAANQRGT